MTDKHEFIARDLMPIAGDFADDYDWDAIADEAGKFDAADGWRLREGIAADIDANGYSDELNAIMASHSRETARVYAWWDDALRCWRYDLAPVSDLVLDHVDTIVLPHGFTTYETVYGEVFATTYDSDGERHGAWRVDRRHSDDTYILVDATHTRDDVYACATVAK